MRLFPKRSKTRERANRTLSGRGGFLALLHLLLLCVIYLRTNLSPSPTKRRGTSNVRQIETDFFDFEFISQLAERESWRKEVHRPIYHLHKWWAKRLGTVFRGILLGCTLKDTDDLSVAFYQKHDFSGLRVFDPFMGSGTTIGEAHKLGFTVLGRDINQVAENSVRVALGPLNRKRIEQAFRVLSHGVGETIRGLYRSQDSAGKPCDVLYHFWVMQSACTHCSTAVDLFPSYVFARNAYPARKPEVQVVCPQCGDIFQSLHGCTAADCPACKHRFDPTNGPASGAKANCPHCSKSFNIIESIGGQRPAFRQYAKLVLTSANQKQYLSISRADERAYSDCAKRLKKLIATDSISLPTLELSDGYNTRQAMRYGFTQWRDFFNDRQLLALSLLRTAITELSDESSRDALLSLFSGTLEFNNVFASYKGEGTGAVRHMFSHHILKPERMPLEANLWGTQKSSGSFSNLFRSHLLRLLDYREAPTEVNGTATRAGKVCSPEFSGDLYAWKSEIPKRGIALSCGDSSDTGLPNCSIVFVVTDPPFFDNVHYSELADFFYAWQQIGETGTTSTRHDREVQDTNSQQFAEKLQSVFSECHRILKHDGLLVFTYHHSRDEGWSAVAEALTKAGFVIVNSHPVKAEMSVATPKSQAKEPIQLDIILVCRKAYKSTSNLQTETDAMVSAHQKLVRLQEAGFELSANDRKVVIAGQLLTLGAETKDLLEMIARNTASLQSPQCPPNALKKQSRTSPVRQKSLFDFE